MIVFHIQSIANKYLLQKKACFANYKFCYFQHGELIFLLLLSFLRDYLNVQFAMSGERHLQLRSSVKFCKDACCHILVAVLGKLPSAEEINKASGNR